VSEPRTIATLVSPSLTNCSPLPVETGRTGAGGVVHKQ